MHPASVTTAGSHPTDADIARRIAAGDLDALGLLMRRHNQMLYRTARSIVKPPA